MMKDILIEIDRLAAEELERANTIYPLFHSDSEGYVELLKEIQELDEDVQGAKGYLNNVWRILRADDNDLAFKHIEQMRQRSARAAAEAVQVVAMCDKFIKSQEARKCQQR